MLWYDIKKLIPFILFLIAMSAAFAQSGNWPPLNPIVLTFNNWGDGNFPASGNRVQWFSFTAASDTHYIYFQPGNDYRDSVNVQLFDSAGKAVGDVFELYNSKRREQVNTTGGQLFYLRVTPYYSSTRGPYNIAFNSSLIEPGEVVPDMPKWPPKSAALSVDRWLDGHVPAGGDQWIKFTATSAKQYVHFIPGNLTHAWVQVFDKNGVVVDNTDNPDDDPFHIPLRVCLHSSSNYARTFWNLTKGQTYYLRVYRNYPNQAGANYKISFNNSVTQPGPNWPPAKATKITENNWCKGDIKNVGGDQWFIFTATANIIFIHYAPNPLRSVRVRLYNDKGTLIGDETELRDYPEILVTSQKVTKGKKYYLWVKPFGTHDTGSFDITISGSDEKPAKQ